MSHQTIASLRSIRIESHNALYTRRLRSRTGSAAQRPGPEDFLTAALYSGDDRSKNGPATFRLPHVPHCGLYRGWEPKLPMYSDKYAFGDPDGR